MVCQNIQATIKRTIPVASSSSSLTVVLFALQKAARSHSETEVVEKSVKQRFRQIMRRNTESVCVVSKQKSPRNSSEKKCGKSNISHRPTPEEARSWQESLSVLLASPCKLVFLLRMIMITIILECFCTVCKSNNKFNVIVRRREIDSVEASAKW